MMLKLRDKVVGHKDAIVAAGDSVTPNIVLVKRNSCGFDIHTVIVTGIDLGLLTELKSLCTFFITHCEAQLKPFITQYGPEIMKEPQGVYEIVISGGADRWIRKHNTA